MTKPGSTATAVNGDLIGTVTLDAKEYQAVMLVDPDGHIHDSKPIYFFKIANQVHVAAASTIHWDLFDADAALLARVPVPPPDPRHRDGRHGRRDQLDSNT